MARRRKYQNRMTRLVQARVSDEHYDWLVQNAIDFHDGELSAAVRDAIEQAEIMERLLSAADPVAELKGIIDRGNLE